MFNFFELICFGGLALLIYAFNLIGLYQVQGFGMQMHFYTLSFAVISSFLIYQPHFLATCFEGIYTKRINIKKVLFSLSLCVGFSVFIVSSQTSFPLVSSILLTIFLFFGSFHFAMQTYGLMKITDDKLKTLIRSGLIFQSALGVTILLAHLHPYTLFGVKGLQLPLDSAMLLSLAQVLVAIQMIGLSYLTFKGSLSKQQILFWITHLVLWSQPFFLFKYFYLVPIFHSLQYLPYLLRTVSPINRSKAGGLILIVVMSLFFLTYLPNYLDQHSFIRIASKPTFYFSVFLISINLHHFFLEARMRIQS